MKLQRVGAGFPALARFAGRFLGIEGSAMFSKTAIQTFATQVERAGFKSGGKVGKVIGWGGGRNSAVQAAERTAQITKDVLGGMREQGLTKDAGKIFESPAARSLGNH
jgi:hypothetical protein